MKKLIFVLLPILAVVGLTLFHEPPVSSVLATGQAVCPNGDGWIKVDGLSGTTYTYTAPEGYEVTDNCYKHSTYVHYGTGATVTADEHCNWVWEGWNLRYRCHQYELSHASFRLELIIVPTSTPEPTVTPTLEPTATPSPTPPIINECDGRCQEEEPIPTSVPVTPVPTNESEPPSQPGPGPAPICGNRNIPFVPFNFHVLRNGSEAVLKWVPTGGELVNVYFKEVGSAGWTHAVSNEPNDGYLVVDHLNPNLGYEFAVEQHEGCGSGQLSPKAVVVDPPTSKWTLFVQNYWSW